MEKKPLVLFSGTPVDDYLGVLKKYFAIDILQEQKDPEKFITENGKKYEAMACNAGKGANADFLKKLPNLKVIASNGVGYDSYDLDYAKTHHIHITNTPMVLNAAVADTALMLLLGCVRHLRQADNWLREDNWTRDKNYTTVYGLEDKTVGILGLGRIGMEIAKRCEAFGLEVVYHNRHQRDGVNYRYFNNLEEMAEIADFLILALPGNTGSEKIINANVLKKLGKSGVLINIARGKVVDEEALITALKTGIIASAGLDVFANEPHVPDALKMLNNVLLTPHIASNTVQTRRAMAQLVADNLRAFFAGQPLLTPVC